MFKTFIISTAPLILNLLLSDNSRLTEGAGLLSNLLGDVSEPEGATNQPNLVSWLIPNINNPGGFVPENDFNYNQANHRPYPNPNYRPIYRPNQDDVPNNNNQGDNDNTQGDSTSGNKNNKLEWKVLHKKKIVFQAQPVRPWPEMRGKVKITTVYYLQPIRNQRSMGGRGQ